MSTTLAKPAEMVDRKWYVIDAAGKPLGRVAAQAAVLLRGKNKTTFTPNVDCGDHVIVILPVMAVSWHRMGIFPLSSPMALRWKSYFCSLPCLHWASFLPVSAMVWSVFPG